jgi:hypothetical protein
VKDLIPRVLHSTGFDYWESGMDLKLGETYYDSFCEYQKRLITNLDSMSKEYKFIEIDASQGIEEVFEQIKLELEPILGFPTAAGLPKPKPAAEDGSAKKAEKLEAEAKKEEAKKS